MVWLWYLVLGCVAIAGYYLMPVLGAPAGARVVEYSAISVSGAVMLFIGVRRNRPAYRRPWLLLSLGQLVYAAADATFYTTRTVLGIDRYPGVDDVLYLAVYPIFAAALLLLVRRRTPRADVASGIDGAVIAVSAALLSWIFLIRPVTLTASDSGLAAATSIAYPVMDLLLLTVAVRLALRAGTGAPALRMLYGFLGLMLYADSAYGWQELHGTYEPGNYLDALWLLAALLLGAAALHPSMRVLDVPVTRPPLRGGAARLATLAGASLVAPATLAVQQARHAPLYPYEIAASCAVLFLLTIARLGALLGAEQHKAVTDALTGLRNRRHFDQQLRARHEQAARRRSHIGVLLIDVDHFKAVNDTYGHDGGDAVLRAVAQRTRTLIRPGDLVARYGGEEFAVLLPGADQTETARVGERIRRGLSAAPIPWAGTVVHVTVSVGGACAPASRDGPRELVSLADEALYAAKRAGRDRLVLSAVR